MAANKLQLFGENLQALDSYLSTVESGAAFTDEQWSDASDTNNSKIRKSGFVPASAASSVALNTALRQACFGANIIGSVLAELLNEDISTDTEKLSDKASDLSDKLYNYLIKLDKLLKGTIDAGVANTARNFTQDGAIADKISKISNDIFALEHGLLDGNIVADTAINYDTQQGNIAQAIRNFNDQITKINSDYRPSYFSVTGLLGTNVSTYYDNYCNSSYVGFNVFEEDIGNYTVSDMSSRIWSSPVGTLLCRIANTDKRGRQIFSDAFKGSSFGDSVVVTVKGASALGMTGMYSCSAYVGWTPENGWGIYKSSYHNMRHGNLVDYSSTSAGWKIFIRGFVPLIGV